MVLRRFLKLFERLCGHAARDESAVYEYAKRKVRRDVRFAVERWRVRKFRGDDGAVVHVSGGAAGSLLQVVRRWRAHVNWDKSA
jgi:hypothetical protein